MTNRKENKKRRNIFIVSAVLLAMVFVFTACGSQGTGSPNTGKDSQNVTNNSQTQDGAQQNTKQPEAQQPADGSENYIGQEKAKEIAFGQAGLKEADFFNIEFDFDNGRPVYEIELRAGGYEYEYDIHAETGEILKSEKDIDDDYNPNLPRT